jgi:hypothetical protein
VGHSSAALLKNSWLLLTASKARVAVKACAGSSEAALDAAAAACIGQVTICTIHPAAILTAAVAAAADIDACLDSPCGKNMDCLDLPKPAGAGPEGRDCKCVPGATFVSDLLGCFGKRAFDQARLHWQQIDSSLLEAAVCFVRCHTCGQAM